MFRRYVELESSTVYVCVQPVCSRRHSPPCVCVCINVRVLYMRVYSQHLCRGDLLGDTALHVCARLNQTECMKLLLRVQPELVNYENQQGLTPLEAARDRHSELCVEMVWGS